MPTIITAALTEAKKLLNWLLRKKIIGIRLKAGVIYRDHLKKIIQYLEEIKTTPTLTEEVTNNLKILTQECKGLNDSIKAFGHPGFALAS